MSKYQNAKIYKIVSNAIDQVYIGSTYQALSARMSGHRKSFKRYINGLEKNFCTSYSILEYGDAEIILIENCPCESKEELNARERFHIENNDCVNKTIPGRTKKEYNQLPEVRDRENEARREKRANDDEYREKKNKQNQESYEKNKDAILEKRRNDKVICEFCESEVRKDCLKRHQRTQKCLACQ